MRLVIQRVKHACVTINEGQITTGKIGEGLCVLVGICTSDTADDVDFCARRLLRMKLFPKTLSNKDDTSQQWSASATDHKLGILLVSQFTLHAKFKKPKPDFHGSMNPTDATVLFNQFVDRIGKDHGKDLVQTGAFGEYMSLTLENDGPVTMIVDSETDNGARVGGGAAGKDDKKTEKTTANAASKAEANKEAATNEGVAAAGPKDV